MLPLFASSQFESHSEGQLEQVESTTKWIEYWQLIIGSNDTKKYAWIKSLNYVLQYRNIHMYLLTNIKIRITIVIEWEKQKATPCVMSQQMFWKPIFRCHRYFWRRGNVDFTNIDKREMLFQVYSNIRCMRIRNLLVFLDKF